MRRLGIVGGGQLALYLCQAAQALGVEVAVLSQPGDAPALDIADRPFRLESGNLVPIDEFIAHSDVVTFDKEAVPEEWLSQLAMAEQAGGVSVLPTIGTLQLLKDKGTQKAWLLEQNLPTLPFSVLSGNAVAVGDLTAKLGTAVVQKTRTGGYDGRGVQIIGSLTSAAQLWDTPSIVESFLPGSTEISVVVARAQDGELQIYPPMSMAFDHELNTVIAVTMPAAIKSSEIDAAQRLAAQAVTALNGVGVFAVEMFLTDEGALLINEISPRVHNSGHLTLDGCNVSQFEQHVRAVLGLPLVAIRSLSPAAMVNILDSEELRACSPARPTRETSPQGDVSVYWYGKTPGRTGRKMGHINALAPGAGEALDLARQTLAHLAQSHHGR
jgi:5-(carboxyamino)imidazole ribonucleotide synthase